MISGPIYIILVSIYNIEYKYKLSNMQYCKLAAAAAIPAITGIISLQYDPKVAILLLIIHIAYNKISMDGLYPLSIIALYLLCIFAVVDPFAIVDPFTIADRFANGCINLLALLLMCISVVRVLNK